MTDEQAKHKAKRGIESVLAGKGKSQVLEENKHKLSDGDVIKVERDSKPSGKSQKGQTNVKTRKQTALERLNQLRDKLK